MTRQQTVDFFKRREEAYEDLDAAALASDYAENAVIESPTAGVHTGRTQRNEALRAVFTAFLDLTMTVDQPHHRRRRRGECSYTRGHAYRRVPRALPPTGKRFTMPAVFFYQLENGKIVHERRIYDFTGLLVQIGVIKAKPA